MWRLPEMISLGDVMHMLITNAVKTLLRSCELAFGLYHMVDIQMSTLSLVYRSGGRSKGIGGKRRGPRTVTKNCNSPILYKLF